jgi:hypothetical protein
MTALIIGLSVVCWLVTSRQMFRYLYRNDILKKYTGAPMGKDEVAVVAMLVSLVFPLVVAYMFVLWKHPVSEREQREKIAALEAEIRELADVDGEADSGLLEAEWNNRRRRDGYPPRYLPTLPMVRRKPGGRDLT